MSYPVPSFGDRAVEFADGTSVLLAGPPDPTNERLYDLLAGGVDDGDVAIVITTNRTAGRVIDAFERRDATGPDRLGIIDVAGDEQMDYGGARVRSLGTPGDLTGMSVEFAKLLEAFREDEDSADRVRVGVSTVSTLLMYAEVRTVFRFLHVFTSRIRSSAMLGGFTVTPRMHEEQTFNTVRTIFDCEAQVDEDGIDVTGSGFEFA